MKKTTPTKRTKLRLHPLVLPLLVGLSAPLLFNSCESSVAEKSRATIATDFYAMDSNGDLIRPTGYRSWVYVGTPVTPNDMNNGKAPFPEMHNVYIDPVSYNHWKQHGEWREGTILVKELVDIGSKAAVSGKGYFAGEFIGLEATIKSKKDFPDQPGNWAYFSFTNPIEGTLKNKATAFKAESCNACHDASAADDFVFTQYYPVLSAAKGVGNKNPEDDAKRKASAKKEMKKKVGHWEASAPSPEKVGLLPTEKEALFKWLKAGSYKDFPAKESAMHKSAGPHQKLGLPVRVFMNDLISESLAAGNAEHPKGSIIVKEMFKKDKSPYGWAVMAKTNDTSDSGEGWFWYEVTDSNDFTKIVAHGNGVTGCFSCHTAGSDYVLSAFPLK